MGVEKLSTILLIALLTLPVGIIVQSNVQIVPQKHLEDWRIVASETNVTIQNTVEVWQDTTVVLNGHLIIKNATLSMRNVTLIFNGTSYGLWLENDGRLVANNCTFTVLDSASQKFMIIERGENSYLYINDTTIEYARACLLTCSGILIYNGNATVNNTLIQNSFGIYIKGAYNVSIENVVIRDYSSTAVRVLDSANVSIEYVAVNKPQAQNPGTSGIHISNTDNLTLKGNKLVNASYILNLTKKQFDELIFENNQILAGATYQNVELIYDQSDLHITYDKPEFIVAYSRNVSFVGVNSHFVIVGSSDISIVNSSIEYADVGVASFNVTGISVYHNYINFTSEALMLYDVHNYSIYLNTFGLCGEYVDDDGAYVLDNGYYGNYWKRRPGQDTDGDGINDESLYLDVDTVDRYPLNSSQFSDDTLPPKLFFVQPKNGSFINKNTVTFYIVTVDEWSGISDISYSVDGGSFISIGTQTSFSESLNEGEHKITVKVTDKKGNYVEKSINITVDLHAPTVWISSPENNSCRNSGFVLEWDANDNFDIDHYTIVFDGNVIASLGHLDKNYSFEYVSEGNHEIIVKAYDKAGNTGQQRIYVTVDVTPPSVYLISPTNGTYTNSSHITLILKYQDQYSSFAKLEYSINGSAWTSKVSLSFTASFSEEGTYLIRVRVYDAANNYRNIVIIIHYDVTPPSLEIESPVDNGTYFEGGIIISWEANDPAGISYYALYINGTLVSILSPDTTNYYTSLSKGNYTITVEAVDNAGNKISKTISIHVISSQDIVKEEKEKPIIDIPLWSAYLMLGAGVAIIAVSVAYKLFLGEYLATRKERKLVEEGITEEKKEEKKPMSN